MFEPTPVTCHVQWMFDKYSHTGRSAGPAGWLTGVSYLCVNLVVHNIRRLVFVLGTISHSLCFKINVVFFKSLKSDLLCYGQNLLFNQDPTPLKPPHFLYRINYFTWQTLVVAVLLKPHSVDFFYFADGAFRELFNMLVEQVWRIASYFFTLTSVSAGMNIYN